MKKTVFFFIFAFLTMTKAWTQTFTVNNLIYEVTNTSENTVTLTDHDAVLSGMVNIPATVTYEGNDYSVTNIGWEAFNGCTAITQIIIPESVTSIEPCAFENCKALTQVNIPDGVTRIRTKTFSACEALIQITIPESIRSIEYYAFEACTSLTQVHIPKNVTSIGDGAFSYCSALTQINVDIANTAYCSENGVLFDKNKTTLLQYPAGKNETIYNMPNNVKSIGNYAFTQCTTLTQVSIPNSVTKIGKWAFCQCNSLTQINIPSSVTSIGEWAFSFCNSLTQMTVLATVPPTINYSTFEYVSRTIPVYVPATALADYQTAMYWKEFYLQALPTTNLQTTVIPKSISLQGGQLHNPQGLYVSLYDMQGRLVYSGSDSVINQPAGVYVMRCKGLSSKVLF